jgi:D-alanyl-D-alanine-carboxypeptidase/D-alanyl-D-alanine-endopeptidase
MRRLFYYTILLSCTLLVIGGCKKDDGPSFNSLEEEIDYLVEKYVKMGAAIGIIDNYQQELELYYGTISNFNSNQPDQHSIFEIGSITKTFTATLLAKMVLDSKINLDDTVQSQLPPGEVIMPAGNDSVITIRHLATHTSGLPRVARDSDQPLPPGYDPYDPYAAYTIEYVYDYLTSWCNLLSEPGTQYYYSNTGGGLLGHILGLVDGTSYEELITREIFEPLGLHETSLFLTADQISNLAPGHDDDLDSVKNYNANDIFQGAGFIKSSLHDMMIYLKAQMGLMQTPLTDAIGLTQQSCFNVGGVTYNDRDGYFNLSIGLGWHIHEIPKSYTYYWHGGRTNGYMAYMAFILEESTGIVLLCNQSSPNIISRFGDELLNAVHRY